ncbi:hypothetical protein GCM10023184_33010 [Flaviaesturariibacter amylovorans]|uniref:Uncharacterized protein n=1 Tax=Flaviaesturariibacter amylovorans TaxID=1084520 RepID=A0ABP8HC18_9BACT
MLRQYLLKKDPDAFAKIQRTAINPQLPVPDLQKAPIVRPLGVLSFRRILKVLQRGAFKIDTQRPSGVIERFEVDPVIMFPSSIAVEEVPMLQARQRIGSFHK